MSALDAQYADAEKPDTFVGPEHNEVKALVSQLLWNIFIQCSLGFHIGPPYTPNFSLFVPGVDFSYSSPYSLSSKHKSRYCKY